MKQQQSNHQESGKSTTTSQKRRAALAAQTNNSSIAAVNKTGENEQASFDNQEKIQSQCNTPAAKSLQEASKRALKDSISALSGCSKGTGFSMNSSLQHQQVTLHSGVTLGTTLDHEHEDATTHEDRKTSTSSDAQFYESIPYGGVTGLELDHPCISASNTKSLQQQSQMGLACKTQGAVVSELKGFAAKQQLNLDTLNGGGLNDHIKTHSEDGELGRVSQIDSGALAALTNKVGGMSNGGQSQSSMQQHQNASIQPHPFNVLLSEYQQKRQMTGSNHGLKKQATVFEFLGSLKRQIRDLDQQYYVYKKLRRQEIQQQSQSNSNQAMPLMSSTPSFGQLNQSSILMISDPKQQQFQPQQQNISSPIKTQPLISLEAQKLGIDINHDQAKAFNHSTENDENSSELANSGCAGANNNGNQQQHIFSQFGQNLSQSPFAGGLPHHFEPFSSFEFQPNQLHFFYPKQVQRQLHKKKYSHSERIIHGLKAPSTNSKAQQQQQGVTKHAMKLKALGECQMQMMRIILQRIDRKSRPIRKQERIVCESLKRRRVNLDDDNPFDILELIQNSYAHKISQQQQQLQQQQTQQNCQSLNQAQINSVDAPSIIGGSRSASKSIVSAVHEQSAQKLSASKSQIEKQHQIASSSRKKENPEDDDCVDHLVEPSFVSQYSHRSIHEHRETPGKGSAYKLINGTPKIKVLQEFNEQNKVSIENTPINEKNEECKSNRKIISNGQRTQIKVPPFKKLCLKKSQSVLLPLSSPTNADCDTEMKEEANVIIPIIETSKPEYEADSKLSIVITNHQQKKAPTGQRRAGGITTKNAQIKDTEKSNLVEAYENEHGALSLKIKIPEGESFGKFKDNFQMTSSLLAPISLTKSKSYTTPSLRGQGFKKRNGGQKKAVIEVKISSDPLASITQHEQEDEMILEAQQQHQQCECECMMQQHHHHHSRSHMGHNNGANDHYYLYGDDPDDDVCQACCNGGEDVLHVNDHSKMIGGQTGNNGYSQFHQLGSQVNIGDEDHLGLISRFPLQQQDQHHHSNLPMGVQDEHSYHHIESYLGSGGNRILNGYSQAPTANSTHLSNSLNRELHHTDYGRLGGNGLIGVGKGHCSRSIDFFDYGPDITEHEHHSNQIGMPQNIFYDYPQNGVVDHHHHHISRGGVEIPSAGKDLSKIGFFNIEAQSMVHDGVLQSEQQQSPDPQGTTTRMMNHQNLMMVDSATPMFTSEFTIIAAPALMVGGLDSAMGGAQHSMINEWNPLGPISSMGSGEHHNHHHNGAQQSVGGGPSLHHHHSHDSFYGGVGGLHHHVSGTSSNNEMQSSFNLRL